MATIVYTKEYADQDFFATEVIGFTNMAELVGDAVGTLINEHGFDKKHVSATDEVGNSILYLDSASPTLRDLKIVRGGVGYKVGDVLEISVPAFATGSPQGDAVFPNGDPWLHGHAYQIVSIGTNSGGSNADFTKIGSPSNVIGTVFTALRPGLNINDTIYYTDTDPVYDVGYDPGSAGTPPKLKLLDVPAPRVVVSSVTPYGSITSVRMTKDWTPGFSDYNIKANNWYLLPRRGTNFPVTPTDIIELTWPKVDVNGLSSTNTTPTFTANTRTFLCQSTGTVPARSTDAPTVDIIAQPLADPGYNDVTDNGTVAISKPSYSQHGGKLSTTINPTINPYTEAAYLSIGVTGLDPVAQPEGAGLTWQNAHGANGSIDLWPRDGFWANVLYTDATSGVPGTGFFIGQEILLEPTESNPSSIIPPGTTITSINPILVVDGIVEWSGPGAKNWKQHSSTYTWFGVSNEITINQDDKIVVRGAGAKAKDTDDITAAGFLIIIEANGGTDPLNSSRVVTGNITASTSSNVYIEVDQLSNSATTKRGIIYEGQNVTLLGAGDPVLIGTVVSVNDNLSNLNNLKANVRLDSQASLTMHDLLEFSFPESYRQPWRLAFEVVSNTSVYNKVGVGAQTLNCYAGTPLQLQDDGGISNIFNSAGQYPIDRAGMMGSQPTKYVFFGGSNGSNNVPHQTPGYSGSMIAPDKDKTAEGFLNREARVAGSPEIYPLNYTMTVTNRGLFFGVWEGNWSVIQKTSVRSVTDKDNFFNWFLVQRPVNRYTGKTLTKGRCPVFCVNSVGYKYWKFVVREEDILHPQQGDPDAYRDTIDPRSMIAYIGSGSASLPGYQQLAALGAASDATAGTAWMQSNMLSAYRIPADSHTINSYAILNTTNQIALTETNTYLISFLHNLTTPRFRYSEELDMVGQTSADVCAGGNDVVLQKPNGSGVYNESTPRVYRAMPSNLPYNTGLRICALKDIPH